MYKNMLLLTTVVLLSMAGSVLAIDHWWHGGVSNDLNDPANWTDRDISTDPTTPGNDITRIGGAWGSEDLDGNGVLDSGEDLNGNGVIDDPVPPDIVGRGGYYSGAHDAAPGGGYDVPVDPVLSETYISRNGDAEIGFLFVLNAPNILTLEDGAFLIESHGDSNLRNGGRLEVQGRSDTDGPSLIVAKQFRIAENGSKVEAAHETSQLRINGTGWVQTSGQSGVAFYIGTPDAPGTMPRGEIIIEDQGRLEVLSADPQPYLDFGNADPSVNQIIICDNGELILPGDPNAMGRVGADNTVTSLQEMIDMGLITSDTGITVSGSNPTVVKAVDLGLGDAATVSLDTSVLPDETWDHDNGNDQWDGSAIGEGNPGGISVVDGYLRFQDTGNPTSHGISDPGSNRKIYLTKDLGLDNAATFLDDGATLFFRVRLATDGVLDPIHPDGGGDLVDVPATGDGYLLHNEAKANINLDQADNGLIGFSLATADENPEGVAGLVMNALNGTTPSGDVDAGEGTANMIELDPTVWHDFWVTIQADTSGVGTHQVDISVDGGPAQTFIVTAGSAGTRHAGTAVLAMGVGATSLSGAIDIAALQFAPGVIPVPVSTQDPGTEGLLAYYAMDGDATDGSGNGNDGVIMGDPGFVDGAAGQAIDLDGDGDYIDCGANPLFGMQETNELTVATWVTIRSVAHQWSAIVAKGEYSWRLGIAKQDPLFHFGIAWGLLSDTTFFDGVTAVGFDEWHHVAAVFDGANMMIYLDGVLDNSVPTTEKIGTKADETNVFIGENPAAAGRYWDGLIDEVLIYNRALSEDEIATIASLN